MRGLGGALIVAALIGLGVYKVFVDPTMKGNTSLSLASTRECVQKDSSLSEIDEASRDAENAAAGHALAVESASGRRAIVFFFESARQARGAREELTSSANGLAQIQQRDGIVLAIPAQDTEQASAEFGRCIWYVEDNVWSSMIGLETKALGKPFDPNWRDR